MVASEHFEQTVPLYFKEIAHERVLSEDEEMRLSWRIQQGDQSALKRLVNANLRFVAKVALRYQHRGLSLADLISEGNWGLIQAARRYDGRRNFKFISYAVWWIRHAILQAIAEKGRLIRQPETHHELFRKLFRVERLLQQRLGREPTEAELAAKLGVSEKRLSRTLAWRNAFISLDAPIEEDENCTLHDILPSEGSGADGAALEESASEQLHSVLRLLDSREGQVVRLYFGLDGFACHTLSEVGKSCQMTGERARQLKQRALRKLRSYSRVRPLDAAVYCSGASVSARR